VQRRHDFFFFFDNSLSVSALYKQDKTESRQTRLRLRDKLSRKHLDERCWYPLGVLKKHTWIHDIYHPCLYVSSILCLFKYPISDNYTLSLCDVQLAMSDPSTPVAVAATPTLVGASSPTRPVGGVATPFAFGRQASSTPTTTVSNGGISPVPNSGAMVFGAARPSSTPFTFGSPAKTPSILTVTPSSPSSTNTSSLSSSPRAAATAPPTRIEPPSSPISSTTSITLAAAPVGMLSVSVIPSSASSINTSVAFAVGVVDNEPAPGSVGMSVTPHPIADEAEVAALAAAASDGTLQSSNGHRRAGSKGGHVRGASHARSSSLLNAIDDFDFAADDDADAGSQPVSPTAIKHSTVPTTTNDTPTNGAPTIASPMAISVNAEVKGPPIPSSPIPPLPRSAPPPALPKVAPPTPPSASTAAPRAESPDLSMDNNDGDEGSGQNGDAGSPIATRTSAPATPSTPSTPSITSPLSTPPLHPAAGGISSTKRAGSERKDRAQSISVQGTIGRSQSVKRPGSARRRSLNGDDTNTSPQNVGGSPPTFSSVKNPRFVAKQPYVSVRDHATNATLAKITVKSHKVTYSLLCYI
jgi:hypothetical protein